MKCRIPSQNSERVSDNMIRRNIRRVMEENQMSDNCANAIITLYDFMVMQDYYGGCHALSSVLYVVLSELGLSPKLCVGECRAPAGFVFDHSWITLDGNIIDLAVYYPYTEQINSVSGPIILGRDVITNNPPRTQYGVSSGGELSADTLLVIGSDFVDYMDNFPFGRYGLWSLVMDALHITDVLTVNALRLKYRSTQRRHV